MSHEIDMTNDRANMAYVGEEPWHGLGHKLEAGLSIDEWKVASGLNHKVLSSPVMYATPPKGESLGITDNMKAFKDRKVLFREDNLKPLAVVGKGYKVVQPGEILEFFRDLTEISGYTLETAGSLHEGKKVWALARIAEGVAITGKDVVQPYLLLATSFDGGMATTAQTTAVRVVCRNTIELAMSRGAPARVSIHHGKQFDAQLVKKQLGIAVPAWDAFVANARRMADLSMANEYAELLTAKLIEPTLKPKKGEDEVKVEDSKPFKRIMELFKGGAIGSDLSGGQNYWQWLNSVTQFVDHERGRSDDSRMNSAWFGSGNGLKNKALELVSA